MQLHRPAGPVSVHCKESALPRFSGQGVLFRVPEGETQKAGPALFCRCALRRRTRRGRQAAGNIVQHLLRCLHRRALAEADEEAAGFILLSVTAYR